MDNSLPEPWEAVEDDAGRTYFWNVDTNEVSWERPVEVTTAKGIATGYLTNARKTSSSQNAMSEELDALRRDSAIANLTKQFSGCSSSSTEDTSPTSKIEASTEIDGSRKPTLSVDALRKYNEAKRALADGSPNVVSPSGSQSSRRESRERPPKVDLYK